MRFILALVALGALLISPVIGQIRQSSVEVIGHDWNGHLYEAVLVEDGISYQEANTAAQMMGGHLVTITSAMENQFVYNLISGDNRYWAKHDYATTGPWIGLSRSSQGSPWQWVTGEPVTYTNWGQGEPNTDYELIVTFYKLGAAQLGGPTWDDLPNDIITQNGFIIEYDFVP